ncbi:HlyD family efflux transporter periplasmic adaptor subunit [Halomonas lysinitropha]|uniref:Multidrug resistance protein MdtN n=1 Tax=Halomonas lysinitropha TaxID=2607506 RepID=A0A5K1I9I4_9GAMM|nr:HlyD family efflux transporter periplasmic adaptor subunit [Halomonas lysinitropha]VVZ96987.1 multidrug resistance protein MdtN [Halomonas lysinitropha]
MTNPDQQARDGTGHPAPQRLVSYLDQALWNLLLDASATQDALRAWLGLQDQFVRGVRGGVVLLGETPDDGPFSPVAFWPDDGVVDTALSAAVELCLDERRAVGENAEEGGLAVVAQPILVDGALRGAVGLRLDPQAAAGPSETFRSLRWGTAWVESFLRRDGDAARREMSERTATALEVMAGMLEQERFQPACTALVTDLSLRLDCDQVAVGVLRGRRTIRIAALSHSAQFGRRIDLVRRLALAMEEAVDQRAAVLWPLGEDWEYRITHLHGELAESLGGGTILTVPLHRDGEMLGALTLQRPSSEPFDDSTIQLVDTLASLVGPVLEEKRLNDRIILSKIAETLRRQAVRLLGPGYFGRKLATLVALCVIGFFSFAEAQFRVTAPSRLEGRIERAIVAPIDGFIASQYAKAGEVVKAGDLLARMDDRDLLLERLGHAADRRQRLAEYDRALDEVDRVEARILQAQIAETDAQIALLDAQIARTELIAPFDGLVISGDLSQTIGSGVRRGDELFSVAPLDSYRVILEVDERDVRAVEAGQTGNLVVSSMPDLKLSYTVERVTPIATADEGRNFFRVEARLDAGDPRLRPGMEGIGKTAIEERLLIEIWSRRLIDWVRLFVWRWTP